MQGISILRDATGQPTVLAVDLQHYDQRLTAAVADLLREVEQIEGKNDGAFWEAAASESLREVWDTPENEAWDTFYQQQQKQGNVPAI